MFTSSKALALQFLGWTLVFIAPIQPVMVAAGALIAADLLTGLWRAWKISEPITSSGLRRTITKVVAYQTAIVTAYVLEKYFIDFVPVVKIVAGFIAVTESKSIYENLGDITGLDFWSAIKDKLESKSTKGVKHGKSTRVQEERANRPDRA